MLCGEAAPFRGGAAQRIAALLRDQFVRPRTDQISSSHFLEGLAQGGPIGGIVVAKKRFVQLALVVSLGGDHLVADALDGTERVLVRVIHGRGVGHR